VLFVGNLVKLKQQIRKSFEVSQIEITAKKGMLKVCISFDYYLFHLISYEKGMETVFFLLSIGLLPALAFNIFATLSVLVLECV
jgi:hypothetical protein